MAHSAPTDRNLDISTCNGHGKLKEGRQTKTRLRPNNRRAGMARNRDDTRMLIGRVSIGQVDYASMIASCARALAHNSLRTHPSQTHDRGARRDFLSKHLCCDNT
jgi:hypothetical protein